MGEGSVRKTSKTGEKKKELLISSNISNEGVGGNGIAGLLVFGGALVVAGFIAVASSFATNRNKGKGKGKGKGNGKSVLTKPEPKPKPKPQQQLSLDDNIKSQDHDDHKIENTSNNDGDAVSASHVTSDMSITQPLILEEKNDSPTCFHHHQEIVLCDDSHPESGASSSNENGIEEECLVSMFHNSGYEPQETLKSIQTETKDDDDDDNFVLESGEEEESSIATEGTALNSKEEEVKFIQTETKDDDDNVVLESGEEEERSKATEGSALLLNPKEEEAEQDFKGEEETTESDIQIQEAQTYISDDASHCAGTNLAVTPDANSNENANFSVGLNHQPSPSPSPSHSFQLITWLMPMLLLASLLLLVLFTQQSFYVLHQGK